MLETVEPGHVGLTATEWEFYFYNVIFGLFQAPYYAVGGTLNSLQPDAYPIVIPDTIGP
jgi:hypothetical protein